MKKKMEQIMENWDSYLSEVAIEKKQAPMTWAQLGAVAQAASLKAQGKLTKEREAKLMQVLSGVSQDLVASLIADLVPMGNTLRTAGTAIVGIFKTYAQQPDKVTVDNPVLAAFNLSDGFQELIDDRLEDAFIEEKMPEVEQMATQAPDTPIPNMDEVIKQWLAKRKIGNTTGNTVDNLEMGAQ
jgi:hypothetical protein|tara:strand:+ start:1773 stop:2324 length:552 start_codon:yes stop_codon:yes gene_type:complete